MESVAVVSYHRVVLISFARRARASVFWGVLQGVRSFCGDLCGELRVNGLIEGCKERGVILFE